MKSIEAAEKEIERFKRIAASAGVDNILITRNVVEGIHMAVARIEVSDAEQLREAADMALEKIGSGVVLLGAVTDEKINLVCMATKEAVKLGIHCGNIVKATAAVVGGKGGGRPDMAQAGGKDVDKLQDAFITGRELIETMLKA